MLEGKCDRSAISMRASVESASEANFQNPYHRQKLCCFLCCLLVLRLVIPLDDSPRRRVRGLSISHLPDTVRGDGEAARS